LQRRIGVQIVTTSTSITAARSSGFTEWISRDPDEVVDILSRRLAPHRLVPRASGRHLNARVATLQLGPALLVDVGYGADVDVHPGMLTDAYLVHAATAGDSQMHAGNRIIPMHSDNAPISSVGMQPRFHMTSSCRHLTLRVPRTALEAYFSRTLQQPITEPVVFSPESTTSSGFSTPWRALLAHIQQQAALVPRLMASERMQRHYLSIVLEMLLQSAPHTYSQWLEKETGGAASAWHVRRACALIESRMSESLSVGWVARKVGVSVRSLQSGFRHSLGITPVQFIRDRRLERLHASLEASDTNASVTQLMLECGIVNFGRFAQYYRKRFGCRPSATLVKGKG
jgi:AraC-like DNA-binding protein